MCFDCSGVTTENSAICVFILIRYGDSALLVTLTANLLSIFVDILREISKLAVSVNFSSGVTVPAVFHFDGWSTKAVIAFVVVVGIVRALSVRTGWELTVVSLEAVLTCIEMYEVVCPVNDYTVIPQKLQPIYWPRYFLHNDEVFSENFVSTFKFKSGCCYRFFLLAICYLYLRIGRIVNFENTIRGFYFHCVQVILGDCTDLCSRVHQGIYR